jgi:hypothetical protein
MLVVTLQEHSADLLGLSLLRSYPPLPPPTVDADSTIVNPRR